ncbi:MAG: ribonuclease III [Dehalococcoidia bacterium]|nr:ribonuclease III [Dehalococcoidia bacterium]
MTLKNLKIILLLAMFDEQGLQKLLGVKFINTSLLRQALVHDSYLNETPGFPLNSNERLEFLGDAVLGYIVADELYRIFPEISEGKLTAFRSHLVCQETLAKLAKGLNLGEYLLLGQGELKSGGRNRPTNLSRAMEAVIGAIALDQGLETCIKVVSQLLAADFELLKAGRHPLDYKSRLQEIVQAKCRPSGTPTYHTIDTQGVAHDRWFRIEVRLGDKALGQGEGKSKRSAETEAAHAALEKLGEL